MIRAVLVVIVSLGLCLAGALWRLSAVAEERDRAAELVAGYEEAARVHRVQIRRLEELRRDAVALDRELQEGIGADAPLSDFLRAGAGRVWP